MSITLTRVNRTVSVTGPGGGELPPQIRAWFVETLTYHSRAYVRDFESGGRYEFNEERMYAIDPDSGALVFPLGLLPRITQGLELINCPSVQVGRSLYELNPEANTPDVDGLLASFKIYPGQDDGLAAIVGADGGLITAPTGSGKAQPLDAQIMTPSGPTTMGQISVGDKICHPSGGTSKVIAIHPQGKIPIYRITFADNTTVRCCGSHLWKVRRRGKAAPYRLKTTDQLLEHLRTRGPRDMYLPVPEATQMDAQPVAISPYVLGVLLGDGAFTKPGVPFTKYDTNVWDEVENDLPGNYRLTRPQPHRYSQCDCRITRGDNPLRPDNALAPVNGNADVFLDFLCASGLKGLKSTQKFVPDEFLRNSKEIRLALVQGLMDTDGSVSADGQIEYSTSSPRLADAFEFLIESLGGTVTRRLKKITHADSHRFAVRFPDARLLFRASTKRDLVQDRPTYTEIIRKIRNIELVGEEEAQCITVDRKDGLYLTDHHIVTHNSVMIRMLCKMYPKAKVHIVTKSVTLANEIFEDVASVIPGVGMFGGGIKRPGRVTVFVADSLHHGMGQADIVLLDECHELVAPSYAQKIGRYRSARVFGFTATPEGRHDGRDIEMEAMCGPVLYTMSYQEAQAGGRVVPISVEWMKIESGPSVSGLDPVNRDRYGIWQNDYRNQMIAARARKIGTADQTLIMVKTIDHIVRLKALLPDYTIVYAADGMDLERIAGYVGDGFLSAQEPVMTAKRMKDLRKQFADGTLKKVISNYVWSTGVNFRHLSVLIRGDGAGSQIRDGQIPGRICRRIPGVKESALLIDCWDEFDSTLLERARGRRRNYRSKGWAESFVQLQTPSKVS